MSSNQVQQLEAFALSFRSPRCCVPSRHFRPRDAVRFAQYCVPMSSDENEAALFLLSLRNSSDEWSAFGFAGGPEDGASRGPCDTHRALSRWDDEHMRAFAARVAAPWSCCRAGSAICASLQ